MSSVVGTLPILENTPLKVKKENVLPGSPPLDETTKQNLKNDILKLLKDDSDDTRNKCREFMEFLYAEPKFYFGINGLPDILSRAILSTSHLANTPGFEKGYEKYLLKSLFNNKELLEKSIFEKGWSSEMLQNFAQYLKLDASSNFVRLTVNRGKLQWALFSAEKNDWFEREKSGFKKIQVLVKLPTEYKPPHYADLSISNFIKLKAAGKRHGSLKISRIGSHGSVLMDRRRNSRSNSITRLYDVAPYSELDKYSVKKDGLENDHMPQKAFLFRRYEKIIHSVNYILQYAQYLIKGDIVKEYVVTCYNNLKYLDENRDKIKNFLESLIKDLSFINIENVQHYIKKLDDEVIFNFKQQLRKILDENPGKISNNHKKNIGAILKKVNEYLEKNIPMNDKGLFQVIKIDPEAKEKIKQKSLAMAIEERMHHNSDTSNKGRVLEDRKSNECVIECINDHKNYFEDKEYALKLTSDLQALGAFRYHYKQVVKIYGYQPEDENTLINYDFFLVKLIQDWSVKQ